MPEKPPILIPVPKTVTLSAGHWNIPDSGWINLDSSSVCEMFAAQLLKEALALHAGRFWQVVRDSGPLPGTPEILLKQDADITHAQGYRLTVREGGVELAASTASGMFYAVQTFIQLLRQYKARLPIMQINDHPDFARRGVYHDISRGKVPKLETILQLVNDLAALKINEFQLYVENVYEFRRHPEMYNDTTPLTSEELLAIDAACRLRHIDFVPSLTSLGHFEKILRRPRYRALAEVEPEDLRKAGVKTWSADPWTLCVTDPAAKQLLAQIYDEFLPNFSSPIFNICCDESWDLGKGRSKTESERLGPGKLYVNWIHFCHGLAKKHGRNIQMWDDIMFHHPKLISQLPVDVTLLEWGYEADHPFAERCATLRESGRPFYVCPGTGSWLTLAGRSANAFANMRNAANAGLQNGAIGFLNTDWGDHGHQHLLGISLLPFAFGAAVSWNHEIPDPVILHAASLQVFQDTTGKIAQTVYDLGNTYTVLDSPQTEIRNSTFEFWLFREPWAEPTNRDRADTRRVKHAIKWVDRLLGQLKHAKLLRPDARLLLDEWQLSGQTIRHTLNRTLVRKALSKNKLSDRRHLRTLATQATTLGREFHRLWLKRNKRSRVADVESHFVRLKREYVQASTK